MGLNYNKVHYSASYGTVPQLPKSLRPEVSFVGRSNVGKSSLINKIFNRKSLAKVSGVPGKTSNINFFECDGVDFIDLPGYGYAKVGHAEKQRWADLISGYFEQERSYNLVVSLVDIRHDAQKLDVQMIGFLAEHEFPFIIALTKGDKLSKSKQQSMKAKLAKQFGLDRDLFVITSSKDGTGIDEVRRRIEAACL